MNWGKDGTEIVGVDDQWLVQPKSYNMRRRKSTPKAQDPEAG